MSLLVHITSRLQAIRARLFPSPVQNNFADWIGREVRMNHSCGNPNFAFAEGTRGIVQRITGDSVFIVVPITPLIFAKIYAPQDLLEKILPPPCNRDHGDEQP